MMNWIYDSTKINKIEHLDYILDYDDNFWIVQGIKDTKIFGFNVYEKTFSKTNKYNNITKKYYIKRQTDKFEEIQNIKYFFKTRDFYLAHKNKLTDVWKQIVLALNNIGVCDKDIGIFGSYLIGFDITKDVDFVVYGYDNLQLVYKNIDSIKKQINASSISDKYIEYQFNKHKERHSSKCDLKKIISRNWSGLQIKDGVLSTLRFVYEKEYITLKTNKKIFTGKIVDSLTSACVPRKTTFLSDGKLYTIYTNFWKFQSFARNGDVIEIYGNVDEQNNIITLEDYDDYIKFL